MNPLLVDDVDRRLLFQLEPGLPLVPQPYAEIGSIVGIDEAEVIRRLERLIKVGVIRRFGVVVRHHEVGYGSNAMVVWDVPDAILMDAVNSLTSNACVTLCYQRPRRLPQWPYNLFAMVHGTSEDVVREQITDLRAKAPLSNLKHDVLFSRRRFKQTGACYRPSLEREVA